MVKSLLPILLFCMAINLFSQALTVNELKDTTLTQSRDLSIPESRIVINPFDFGQASNVTPSFYSNRPSLPLNTGYLTTERVSYRKLNNVLLLYRYDPTVGKSMEANTYHTVWMPNELPFDAVFDDKASLTGTDFFYDVNTLVRRVQFTDPGNGNKFLLAGAYDGQSITFENQVLIQNKGIYKLAISTNAFDNFQIRFFNSLQEMKSQTNGQSSPSNSGYWDYQNIRILVILYMDCLTKVTILKRKK